MNIRPLASPAETASGAVRRGSYGKSCGPARKNRIRSVALNSEASMGGRKRRNPDILVARHARCAETPIATNRTKRSEEHTSEPQSLMRLSYAVFCLKKKKN